MRHNISCISSENPIIMDTVEDSNTHELEFGKHNGLTLAEVKRVDPTYFGFLCSYSFRLGDTTGELVSIQDSLESAVDRIMARRTLELIDCDNNRRRYTTDYTDELHTKLLAEGDSFKQAKIIYHELVVMMYGHDQKLCMLDCEHNSDFSVICLHVLHRDTVVAARNFCSNNRMCLKCFKKVTPAGLIGSSTANTILPSFHKCCHGKVASELKPSSVTVSTSPS